MSSVKCVLVNSNGRMDELKLPRFSSTFRTAAEIDKLVNHHRKHGNKDYPDNFNFIPDIRRRLEVKEMYGVCPIAEKAGFPLIVARASGKVSPDGTKWTRDDGKPLDYEENSPGTALLIRCEFGDGFGWVPHGWVGHAGTILVARQDKKDLLPEHVEVLHDTCKLVVAGLNSLEIKESGEEANIRSTFNAITSPEGFNCAWKTYALRKTEEAFRWFRLPSPSEVTAGASTEPKAALREDPGASDDEELADMVERVFA